MLGVPGLRAEGLLALQAGKRLVRSALAFVFRVLEDRVGELWHRCCDVCGRSLRR